MNPRIAIDVSCKLPKRFNAKRLIPFSTFLLLFCFLVPSTRLLGQTFTSTGTWVCPVGVTSITVECWGGGGAGGGSVTVLAPNAGAGGGGGGYTKRTSVSVTPGNTYNVIVGQGGSGNVAFTVNGNNGGNSYFGTSTALAYGGNGGGGNGGSIGTGGIGSTWNGGDGALAKNSTTSGGGGGGAGYGSVGGNANQITPGSGGIGNSSGTGGAGFSSNANGNSGNIIAGGGSGAGQSGIFQSWTGGSGANGEVILTNTSPPTVTGISSNICVGGSITITGTNFAGITAANVKIGATAVSSITSSTSTQIVAVVATACTGTVSVTTSGGTATSSATFTAYSYPAAPTVTTPINYCLNAVASQLTATGSNLTWGSGSLSGTAGGTTTLSTLTYIDGAFSNKKTNFTTTAANVKIISINYYIPAWQSVSNLVLALYNSSGTVIATSSTSTTLTNGGSPVTITNIFNYTIASAGNYSIGISTGTGTIGGDSPSFPITEATGTINVTGTTNPGSTPYHCFNNIQFSVNNGSIAPTPSTSVAGTTNYLVSQTVSGCVSPQATIAVIVNNPPSATISYSGTPYCISLGTAQNVTLTGTSGGTYSASPSGLSINSSTGAITPSTSTPGTYTVTYTIPPSGGCAVYTTTTSLTVSALSVGGSVGSNATVCSGTNSGTVNLTGQTGNVLNWQYSTDGGTTWTSIANTTTSQTFTNLTQTTSGRAVVQNGGCSSANSNAATVTVNAASVGGSVGSNATVCSGSNSGTLNLTGQTGSVVNWQYSTDSGTTWTSIANTTTSQTYSNLTQTTLYKAVVQSGVCSSANSSAAIITVNAASVGGSVGSNATVCSGTNSGILNLTGQTGSIINWQYSTNGGTTWTTIANTTTSQTYTNLTQTTLYRAVVQNGVCSSAFSSSATITVNAIPAAPTVTTPINYCLNAVASQLTATGSNLTWGSGSISGSVGGTSILSTVVYIDNNYNNKKTNFTTTVPNVTISNIDYYIPSYQAVSGMVLAIYNSSGAVIATSSTTTTLTAGSSTVKISNSFSYTISTAGNYGVGVYAGSGNIGSDNPSFPITESTGTINITGVSVSGSRCFNNIQFTVNNGSIAPTPSTSTTGTTNYFVSQTVNGCVSPQATIAVIVGAPSSATISYSGTPFCKSVGTAQAVIQSGTSGGAYSASPSGLTINSSTGAITPSSSTAGTYTVTYTMAAAGGCSAQTATSSVTITTAPSATVSYSGSPFCINSGSVSVTQTGIAGGTYSSTSGLFINSSTGAINLNSSSAGTYTVTYTIAASGGCAIYTTTTSITITPSVGTPVFTLGSTSSRCQGAGSVTYTATATNAGTITYSLDAASISGGNSINSSTGAVTYGAGWNGTSTITVSASGCGGPATAAHTVTTGTIPSVSATTTYTCVGGTSGTITASGSGGSTPYTYSLNGGAYQSGNLFAGLAAGTYSLSIKSNTGCIVSTPASIIVSPYPNSTDDQTATGTNTWIGHMYSGMNFQNYIGHFTEAESFDEGFGGDYNCFTVSSGATYPSIYTEQFSVRFRMNSSRDGLYAADLGSDDGSRLYVDGTLIYNNWVDQSFSTRPSVLMNLTGSSSLVYEFYENAINNRVIFNNIKLILANNLTSNTTQSICSGSTGAAIAGDSFGTLPSGISLSGTGYQWTYSTTPTGTRTNITGATSATYSPNTSSAPFNVAGTYYLYRNAILSSSNNTGVSPYVATNESNAATITVSSLSVGGTVGSNSSVCSGVNSGTVNLTGQNGNVLKWQYSIDGGTSWTDVANTTTSQSFSNLTQTMLGRAVVQSGVCASANSNPATITVNPVPSAVISYPGSPFCAGGANGTVTQTGTTGGTYSSTTGLSINSSTGAIDLSSSTPGNYTVTYTIAAGVCSAYSTTTNVLITLPGSWIGTVSADWNDIRNWLCGQIPNSVIDATISGGASYYPNITSGIMYARNININSGGTLTVAGGTLQIFGSISNSGTFDASNGSIEMHGTSPQIIPAGAFTNNNVKNLIISNTSSGGITVAGNVDVYQSLTYGAGGTKLNTGGYITLKSAAAETAWVGDMTGHTITGDVTVERYVAAIDNWQFLAVPTQTTQTIHQAWQEAQNSGVVGTIGYGTNITGPTGGIGLDFTSPNYSMKYWDYTANSYKTITNTGIQFPNIKNGFFIYIRGDRRATASGATPHQPTVLRTKGPLYTGAVNFTIPANTYYSIGNPYASRVDFSSVSGIAGVGSTFYVWDPLIYGSRGAGGYQTFSLAGGYKPLVPTSYYDISTPDPYLESGQAAFVYNPSTSSPVTMTFAESNKATSSHLVFRAEDVSASEFFRTYLVTSTGKIADGNAVVFNIKYQDRIDANDARKISNTGENLGLRRDGIILAIEARAPLIVTDTIYYDLRNVSMSNYSFQFSPENMQDESLTAYLLDNYLKTSTAVSLAGTTNVNFTVNSDAASYAADRFMVVFRQASVASVASVLPVTFVSIKAVQKNEDVVVSWNVANENNLLQYEVEKSTDGTHFEKVATVAENNNGTVNYQWIDKNASSGYNYYRVVSIDKDNRTSYSTVVNVLIPNLKPAITIYPNPITDGIIHLQLVNQPEGRYGFRLLNPLGQVLVSKQSEFAGGNGSENIQWNYNLPHGVYQMEITRPDGSVTVIRVLY